MRINLYAQNQHVVIVDGLPLGGFAEGDYIQIKADGNVAARSMGGDGPAMNLSVAQGGQVTISLMPTSPALGTLYGIREAQAIFPRMFGIVVMTGVREIINCAGCAFGDLAQFQTGGEKMQPRQFVFECLEVSLDSSAVETISGGFVGGLL